MWVIFAGLLMLPVLADDPPATPRERLQALIATYESANQAVREAAGTAQTNAQRQVVSKMPHPSPIEYAPRFLALAEESPRTPEAEDALIWVAAHLQQHPAAGRADDALARDYATSKKIGATFPFQARNNFGSREAERLLRAVVTRSPHREVRGQACYWLGVFLSEQTPWVRNFQREDVFKKIQGEIDKSWGAGAAQALRARDADSLASEAERLFEKVIEEFPDVQNNDPRLEQPKELGGVARIRLDDLRKLVVGKVAPDIVGQDLAGQPFRLGALRGRVVILDFGSYLNCSQSQDLLPYIHSLTSRLKDRPFTWVSIYVDPRGDKLRAMVREEKITWPVIWDQTPPRIHIAWNIQHLPTLYVIDGAGVIRYRSKGFDAGEVDAAVEAALKAAP